MEIKNISVLGAGTMGHGIAQVCAQAGFQVILEDIKPEFVQRGLDGINKFLNGSIERKRLTREEADIVLSRIKTTTSLEEAGSNADLIIEAIVEDLNIKQDTFQILDKACPPHTIFASNTSYQSITEIAAAVSRVDRVVGMHWFNPPPLVRGLEIISTDRASEEIIQTMVALGKKLGKEPVVCKDSPGFIANRILQVWRNESLKLYDEAAASFQDIDKALKTAYSFKIGPFELIDMVGLDIAAKGNETFYNEFKRDVFKVPRSLQMLVRVGELGRKTGKGFYNYK